MISLQNVTKTVRSGVSDLTILSDVSLDIPDGQFVALTGASGSGKSTLLGLIAGLDSPSYGHISVDGDEITAMSEYGLADLRSEKLGFVFQSFHFIPSLTAFENVLIPMEVPRTRNAKDRAAELLDDVGLTSRGHHYPPELSGSDQQRVAVARALAHERRILRADEPTSNLDSQHGAHFFELMPGVHDRRPVTLVLGTHNRNLAGH